MYQILVLDYTECCFAKVYSDGEVQEIFSMHSAVTNKHKTGGQSAQRFERIRDNEITLWFKRINEALKNTNGDIIVGISPIYTKRFIKLLSTYNKQKIKNTYSTEYTNLSGVYQMINKLNELNIYNNIKD